MLKLLYFAFVYPHLLYAIEMYGNTNHCHLSKLEKLNKILRILQNRSIRTNNIELYKYYDTLPLPLLHNYQILLFLQRFYHHSYTLPDVFVTYFTQISSIHNYNTRGKRNLYFTTTETETGKKALTHKGCILWNKLPEGLKTIKSVAVFKHRIRDYLISNYIV